MDVKNNANRAVLAISVLGVAAAAFVPRLLRSDVKRYVIGKERAPEAQKAGPGLLFTKDAVPEGIVVRSGKLLFQGKNLPPDTEIESRIFAAAQNYLGTSRTQTAIHQDIHNGGSTIQEVFVSRSGETIRVHRSLVRKNSAWFFRCDYDFDEKTQKLRSISAEIPDWNALKITAPVTDYIYDSVSGQCSPASIFRTLDEAFTSWPEKKTAAKPSTPR